MPPSVVKLDILATDMARKGAKAAYYDVVAAMLNLDPVDLFDKGEAEERRRRRMRQVGVGVLSTGILAGTFFAWDYYVPKHRYYASYEERNNIPVGIHEYSRKDLQTLGGYYHFKKVRGKVYEVEYCDHRGRMADVPPFPWNKDKTSGASYYYDDKGIPVKCVHVDKFGVEKFVRSFTNDRTIEYKGVRLSASAVLGGMVSEPTTEHSLMLEEQGLSRVEFQNNFEVCEVSRLDGYVSSEQFRSRDGVPCQDKFGVWGHCYERDSRGRILKILFTDPWGRPMKGKNLVWGVELDYGADPLPQRLRYLGPHEKHIAQNGVYEVRYRWQYGNLVELSFQNEEGKLVENSRVGFAFARNKLLPNGALVESWYFDVSGETVDANSGCAGSRYEYDAFGNLSRIINLDSSEQPVSGKEGWCSMTIEYDALGREARFAMFDAQGRPCLSGGGYSSTVKIYDVDGNICRQEFYGEDGGLCCNRFGYAILETSYAKEVLEKHHTIEYLEMNCLGADEQPIVNKFGFSRIYIGTTFCNCSCRGKICGAVYKRQEYDERGNETREIHLGVDGKPVRICQGYTGIRRKYDDQNNKTLEMYLDEDDKPVVPKTEDYAGYRREYDERGRETQNVYLGVDGKPVMRKEGYAGYRCEYNDQGKKTLEMYLGVDGKPVVSDMENCAGYRWEYDERGINTMYLGVDGNPVLSRGDYAGIRREYDERGINTVYLGIDGEPVLTSRGYAGIRYEYNECANKTLEMYLGVDGKPMALDDGTFRKAYRYDERGENRIRTEYYDREGKLLRAE